MSDIVNEGVQKVEQALEEKIEVKAKAIAEEIVKNKMAEMIASNHAPAISTGKSSVIKHLESKTGKSLQEVLFGTGDTANPNTEASTDLGATKYTNLVDEEARREIVQLKKDFWAAGLQAAQMSKDSYTQVSIKDTPYYKRILADKVKAYDVSSMANFAATPANASFYASEFEGLEPSLIDAFPVQQMKSTVEYIRGLTGLMESALVLDTSTFTANTTEAQATSTLTAKDNAITVAITRDLLDDADPAAFNELAKRLTMAIRRGEENALINGDDTATHQDSDTHALSALTPGTFAKAWKGLRKLALANTANVGADFSNATFSLDAIKQAAKKLGIFTQDPQQLLLITGTTVGNLVKFGTISELLTQYSFGQDYQLGASTVKIPRILGLPMVESRYARENLNATGVYDGITTDRAALIAVHKDRFIVGRRGGYRLWMTPNLANIDNVLMSAKSRVGFAPIMTQSATETAVSIVYNIKKT